MTEWIPWSLHGLYERRVGSKEWQQASVTWSKIVVEYMKGTELETRTFYVGHVTETSTGWEVDAAEMMPGASRKTYTFHKQTADLEWTTRTSSDDAIKPMTTTKKFYIGTIGATPLIVGGVVSNVFWLGLLLIWYYYFL